ncbi:hypothetical protein, partial [Undibacterium luofuense]
MMRKWMIAGLLAALALIALRLLANDDSSEAGKTASAPRSPMQTSEGRTAGTESQQQTASWPPPFPELKR